MKKNHLFGMFAMTAFAFVSCSQDEVVTQSPEVNKAIEFGTYVGRDAVSRGSVQDLASLTGTTAAPGPGFGVFAYYTDESDYIETSTEASEGVAATKASPCNFMYNQQVTGTSTTTGTGDDAVTTYSWSYTPVKYWPNDPGDKLTFFAYAPYDDAASAGTDEVDNISFSTQDNMAGDPIITFKVNNTVKNQTDLLVSKTDNKNKVKNQAGENGIYIDEKVEFKFAHALSRIGFTVKAITDEVTAGTTPIALNEATTIVLKKVILSGATHTAAVDKSFSAPNTGVFHSQGTINLNQVGVNETTDNTYKQVTWTVADDDTKQLFTLENANFKTQTGEEDVYNNAGYVITGGENGNSTKANPLNADDSYIMIIPQDLSSTGFYVYVEYDVITKDANLGFDADKEGGVTYDDLKSKITNHISNQVKINFQSGKAYTLNLQLGMTSVKVTADVDEWSPGQETSVDLPQNTQEESGSN